MQWATAALFFFTLPQKPYTTYTTNTTYTTYKSYSSYKPVSDPKNIARSDTEIDFSETLRMGFSPLQWLAVMNEILTVLNCLLV